MTDIESRVENRDAEAREQRPGLLSSSVVGSVNRSRILQSLVEDGSQSRADLARRVNVPRATVSTIVGGLLRADVLIEEAARPQPDGIGKPARPLALHSGALLTGAIVLTPGQIEIAVADARGTFLTRFTTSVPRTGSTVDLERRVVDVAARTFRAYRGDLSGVGLSVPALCDPDSGEVLACTVIPALEGSRLPRKLTRRLGTATWLDQDVRAFAIGEKWFGRARGRADFAAVQIGAGVGGGVMLPGHLLEGVRGYTTQLGHTCVDRAGMACTCGLRGCWETIASTKWLRASATERGIAGGRRTTAARLARRAEHGDRSAGDLLDEYADNLAIGMANLVQLLSLRLFIVHGDVIGAGERFRATVEQRVVARSMPVLADGVEVIFSDLEQNSGLLGAAATALARYLDV